MPRKIRVLVGKPGLDGHDRGAKVVAAALRDAGMEVIYTGLHQSPEQIVEAALQEDVDVVALSILSGAHMTLFPEVLELMQQRGLGDKLLTGGGIIPPEEMRTLAGMGVGRLFGPGASTQDIAAYIREWFAERSDGAGAAAPARSGRRAAESSPKARPRAARAASTKTARRRAAAPRASGTTTARRPAARAARKAATSRRGRTRPARPGTRKSSGARRR